MSEYIERGALMQEIGACFEPVNTVEQAVMLNHTLKTINNFPAADVVEVKHGRWEATVGYWVKCSVCGDEWNGKDVPYEDYFYCPNCGAKMDGE